MELFEKILSAVLIAVLPILAGFFCDLIHKLANEAVQRTKDERTQVMLGEIEHAVQSAVVYVNQTFVDELKKSNQFSENAEYADVAFETAYEKTLEILTEDAKTYIEKTFGDLQDYLEIKIEESVHYEKRFRT